jgi:hypothetical protein
MSFLRGVGMPGMIHIVRAGRPIVHTIVHNSSGLFIKAGDLSQTRPLFLLSELRGCPSTGGGDGKCKTAAREGKVILLPVRRRPKPVSSCLFTNRSV